MEELMTLEGHSDYVNGVCWSPDGKRITSGSDDRTVKVWEAKSGQELMTLKGHSSSVYGVCWSPGGQRIASGSDDYSVKVWDLRNEEELLQVCAFALLPFLRHTAWLLAFCCVL